MTTIHHAMGASKRIAKLGLPSPLGWGGDSLSDFIEAAHQNRIATYVNKRKWFERLSRLDACFMRVATDWLNPNDFIAPHLFLRSHAAFRAACEHALAGQVAEIFPPVRASLEFAGYALHLHLHQNHSLVELWLGRHDNKATMKAVKDEFKISKIRTTIEISNKHIAEIFDQLYQRAIDFGGHPNERAVTSNITIKEDVDRTEFQQIYLHGDNISLA